MARDVLRCGEGRFWRGNLHCHSDRSDGLCEPEAVAAADREAGYDFIALSDHFEERFGWRITDTRDLRTGDFTTIPAAELSSGPWSERNTYWVSAVGLPLDFDAPPAGDPAEVIPRAHDAGAFVVLLHPGLNNLALDTIDRLPGFDSVDAVEIYNHNTFGSHPDHADGGLRSGSYYSTQGPRIERLELDGRRLYVSTSSAHAIALGGAGDRWLDGSSVLDENGGLVHEGTFDLSAFHGSDCRVTVIDAERRRAWSNPIWP